MKNFLKNCASKIPYPVGRMLTKIPFRYRLGSEYVTFSKLIRAAEHWSLDQKITYIIENLNRIKTIAEFEFPFYRELYYKYGVGGKRIKDFSDWTKLPFVKKEELRTRLGEFSGSQIVNTGGTSGQPFTLFIDRNAWAREWAHMHYIWEQTGYNFKLPKLTVRGKKLGERSFSFNPVHNEFVINSYKNFGQRRAALEIKELIVRRQISFVHGYPSSIYNLFRELEEGLNSDEIKDIRAVLKTCLFGSEFPLEYMVRYLKNLWGLEYISWYGHSEMCILAYDKQCNNEYSPFHTYGFSEIDNGSLIGTSFHNSDMPLIRYHTGDVVEGKVNQGLLESFSIKEGRTGDFVVDKKNKIISLTSLIYGRHHRAFDIFDFVQVSQQVPGCTQIFVTNKFNRKIKPIAEYFDFDDVEMDFEYKQIEMPILSNSGKLKLKI